MSKMYRGDFTEVELNSIEGRAKGYEKHIRIPFDPQSETWVRIYVQELVGFIDGMASTIRWLWERNRKTQDDLNAANDAISESPGLNTSIEDCDVDLVYPGEDERQDIRDELDKATNAIALARTKLGR